MSIKEDLQTKLSSIRGARANIPNVIAGVISTEAVTSSVDLFIEALTAYIDSLSLEEGPCADCANIEDERERIICRLENCYGLTALAASWNNFSLEQLQAILDAVETLSERLATALADCLADDQLSAEDLNLTPEAMTPQGVFQSIYGRVDFRYDPEGDRALASTETLEDYGFSIVQLTAGTFVDPETGEPYDDQTIKQIIIHELGHIFHNLLHEAEEPTDGPGTFTINPLDAQGQPVELMVTVSGDSPGVFEDYLLATSEEYYAGDFANDFGDWYRPGGFIKGDPYVVPLTNLSYDVNGQALPVPENCRTYVNGAGDTFFYVDRNGRCTDENRITYIRPRGTYIAGQFGETTDVDNLFSNELGRTSQAAPREGFADTFAVHILLQAGVVSEERFPVDEPRRRFMEDNLCCWVYQLMQLNVAR